MKLNEIEINPEDIFIESIISQYAASTLNFFNTLKSHTNNFEQSPGEIFSRDEISDYINELSLFKNQALVDFELSHQTIQILDYLLAYFHQ